MDVYQEPDTQRRFSGMGRLFGREAAERVRQAHVVVVGIGGVGSWSAEALARSGVGHLTLIDMDHIAESNVNRQIHALTTTLGKSKVDAMRERIALIHPGCEVNAIDAFVSPDNWLEFLPARVDGVVDACDQVKAKVAMAAWARTTGTPYVAVGAAGGKRYAHHVDVADLSNTTHDPLLAQVRYQLRKHHGAPAGGKKMHVSCIFSPEAVQVSDPASAIQSDNNLNCHGYGSLVTVTATFGMCAAGWIIDKISRTSTLERNIEAII